MFLGGLVACILDNTVRGKSYNYGSVQSSISGQGALRIIVKRYISGGDIRGHGALHMIVKRYTSGGDISCIL